MIDDKIQFVIRRINQARGEDFFNTLVQALAGATDADYVFIAQVDKTTSTTIALAKHGKILDNFSYDLIDTPCADVTDNQVCIYADHVCNYFPKDELLIQMSIEGYVGVPVHDNEGNVLGILVALFEHEISHTHAVESLFQLFTGLIGGHIVREQQRQILARNDQLISNTVEAILQIDRDGNILYANQAFQRLIDQSEDFPKLHELLRFNHLELSCAEQLAQPGTWREQATLKSDQRKRYIMVVASNFIEGQRVICLSDVSELKKQEQKLYYQANYDPLTSAGNRELFHHRLGKAIAAHSLSHSHFALLLIDLDGFKSINKRYGTQVGDQTLTQATHHIKSCISGVDTLARIGSNEFAIVANCIDSDTDAHSLAERIQQSLSRGFDHSEVNIPLSASIAVATFPEDGHTAEQLYHHSDSALSKAKQLGKGHIVAFDIELQRQLDRVEYLRNAIATGIQKAEFSCHYQPIVDLRNGEIRKLEALLRWKHDGQWISPAEFIPIAERFDLIRPLGDLALKLICLDHQWLRQQYYQPIQVSINRSARELPRAGESAPNWLTTLEHYQLPANLINIEITETILSPSNESETAYLNKLRQAGVKLSIDDFGTGYSSLNYLRRFQADFLKIDRSFIQDLSTSEGDIVLVSTMISMAKSLGMQVVAEGIENKVDVRQLQDMDCDYGQGFLFAKPQPITEIPDLIGNFKAEKFGLQIR